MKNLSTSIAYLGDIHGHAQRLVAATESVLDAKTIIQVGDFGLFPVNQSLFRRCLNLPTMADYKIIFIDGNHDDHSRSAMYRGEANLVQVWSDCNLWYAPRGAVVDIEGIVHGFMGGAASVDEAYRRERGLHFDRRENIFVQDMNNFHRNAANFSRIDVLVTHAPTQTPVSLMFPPLDRNFYKLPPDWQDPNFMLVQELMDRYNPHVHVCGHMHKWVRYDRHHILDIDMVLEGNFDPIDPSQFVLIPRN